MSDRMTRWTAMMRGERYAEAWDLALRTLAERDPATRDDPARPYHQRWVWDGTPPDGREVLVRCYHGLGDTIQFARFLPLLAARARAVIVEAPAHLLPVLAAVTHRARFVPFDVDRPLKPAELDIEITELDLALRATPRDAPVPYLRADAAALPAGTVALCHGAGDWDPARSIPPELLRPIAAAGPAVTLMPGPSALPVLNPEGCPLDLAVTAALVAGAAAVVTVDTMIAHLAGALGRPTLLLLKAEPDWRWNPARRDTPWYPGTRLYPQPRPGDWASVVDAALRDLAAIREQGEG